MMSLVTAKSNPIIFWINDNFFTPPLGRLSMASTRFLLMNVLTHATYVDSSDGQAGGIVTMRSLCESVLPNYQDPDSKDLIFDAYIRNGNCKRGGHLVEPSATTGLKYKQSQHKAGDGEFMSGTTFFHYTIDPSCLIDDGKGNKKAPLWPNPTDHENWAGLIIEWLNGTHTTSENYSTKGFPTADGTNALSFYWVSGENGVDIVENTSTQSSAGKASMDTKYKFWFGTDASGALGNPPGDNWISRMGLPFNSPLVVGFVNNKFTTGGVPMDPTAFSNLVGGVSGGVAGGWVGFCQGYASAGISADQLYNFISTAAEWQPTPSPPPCKKSAVGGVLGFLGPMLGAGLFAIATGGWGAVAMMGVGAVQGGIAAYQSQQC